MKLTKSPLGLLELFNLKTLGQAPPEFGETVLPVADVRDFYGVDRLLPVNESQAAGAITSLYTGTTSVFPRRYLALGGTMTIGAAAGTVLSLSIELIFPGGTRIVLGQAFFNPTTIAGTYHVQAELPCPIVIPAGCAPAMSSFGDAGGADHVKTMRYLFQRLDN